MNVRSLIHIMTSADECTYELQVVLLRYLYLGSGLRDLQGSRNVFWRLS